MSKILSMSLRAGAALAVVIWASAILTEHALGANAARPDFAPNAGVGWVAASRVFMRPPGGGPGPVVDDPTHPGANNDDFRNSGRQPTFPLADLSNPILQPWVRQKLKEHNDRVLAGKATFPARSN